MIINNYKKNEPIYSECCVCGGPVGVLIAGSAFIVANNKEYRVHYHKACLNENTKSKISNILNEMARTT